MTPERTWKVFTALYVAMQMGGAHDGTKTDIIGIACQCGHYYNPAVKREEVEQLLGMNMLGIIKAANIPCGTYRGKK